MGTRAEHLQRVDPTFVDDLRRSVESVSTVALEIDVAATFHAWTFSENIYANGRMKQMYSCPANLGILRDMT